uniref:homeobox-leucine zipper protein HOX11-like n=1 Tax=Erigeron canadensis TaxID=72917 RepID=UPI001CB91BD5|nr:homeobox-leucine zipper protein HOX11-like [Erigeron canadensis]
MELALSLGDTPKPFSTSNLLDHHTKNHNNNDNIIKDLGFCMGLSSANKNLQTLHQDHIHFKNMLLTEEKNEKNSSSPPLQLDLLPFSPVLRSPPPPPASTSHRSFPWLSKNLIVEPGSQTKPVKAMAAQSDQETGEEPVAGDESSPNNSNSGTSSFQMEFSTIFNKGGISSSRKRSSDLELATTTVNDVICERASSMISDDDENGLTRKKLRLTKEQSSFLEDSFKEHSTLNPKQKQALAKQLNLRPRQVEVWFQNRRARTKLKQTEVDCEYLKRCCDTLTEENRRLQKELQELRALKTSQPFYMQRPATTLTMCPSCERIATTTTTTAAATPRQQLATGASHH